MKKKMIISEDTNQITILDDKYYLDKKTGEYYPRLTYVLDCFPKGTLLKQYLMDMGNEAKIVLQRAADEGSLVHSLIHTDLTEKSPKFDENKHNEIIWKQYLKFKEFQYFFKPEILKTEYSLICKILGIGGTLDLIAKINGENWLIDYKTSKNIYIEHFIQIATYAQMIENQTDIKIDRIGVLHLKAKTKTIKVDNFQGKGWQLIEPIMKDEIYTRRYLTGLFKKTYGLFRELNRDLKPFTQRFPMEIRNENDIKNYMADKYNCPF